MSKKNQFGKIVKPNRITISFYYCLTIIKNIKTYVCKIIFSLNVKLATNCVHWLLITDSLRIIRPSFRRYFLLLLLFNFLQIQCFSFLVIVLQLMPQILNWIKSKLNLCGHHKIFNFCWLSISQPLLSHVWVIVVLNCFSSYKRRLFADAQFIFQYFKVISLCLSFH